MLSSQIFANKPFTQFRCRSSTVARLLPFASLGGGGAPRALGRGWESRGEYWKLNLGSQSPVLRPLSQHPPCLVFLLEAVELCGLYDARIPGKGVDEEEPVPPALPPAHEDHPHVRSLCLGRKGGSAQGGAGHAASALPKSLSHPCGATKGLTLGLVLDVL